MAYERPTDRVFEVVSKMFVHGAVGELVTLSLTDNQELSLLESGAVKRVEAVKLSKEVSNDAQ